MPTDTAVTLATVTSDLRAWLDTIDAMDVDDEGQREAALAEFSRAIVLAKDKVARFAAFVLRADEEAKFSRAEARRLTDRARWFEGLVEKLKDYARDAMEENNLAKLDGHGHTLSLRKAPASVLILDEAAVPASYKTLTITVPAAEWELHIGAYDQMRRLFGAGVDDPTEPCRLVWSITKTEVSIDKAAVKKDLQSGNVIDGADLTFGRNTLQIK